jgi:hypothetical protein
MPSGKAVVWFDEVTVKDVPEIKAIPVETVTPGGPFGAKEAGEGVTISSPPAIVNADDADFLGTWPLKSRKSNN